MQTHTKNSFKLSNARRTTGMDLIMYKHCWLYSSASNSGIAFSTILTILLNVAEIVELENTEEILDFCKVYGLPYSAQKCLALRKAINSQEDSFSFHFDSLYINEMLTEADYAIHSREALDDAQYHFWITEIVDEDIMPLILFNRCVKLVRSILNIQNWLLRYEGCPNSIIHALGYLLFLPHVVRTI